MTQWYVKDLSKLTHVSVQTLHHYDRIGLLAPSIRRPNGYRLYSEKDLLKLQQILALKYFGFTLAHIKTLLEGEVDVLDHLAVQSTFLEEKANTMLEASHALKGILSECNTDKSIPWETIIQLIEVYRMTEQLEKTWGKVLSPEEFKDYVNLKKERKSNISPEEEKSVERDWANIIKEVMANLDKDPTGQFGTKMGKRALTWAWNAFGQDNAALRAAVWEKGFKGGPAAEESGLSPEGVKWLDKAMEAYFIETVINILNKVETHPHDEVLTLWNDFLYDAYGNNQDLKDELVKAALSHDQVSQAAKDWLKKL